MGRKNDWIEMSLVSACALRCDYCAQSLLAKRYKESGGDKRMTLETFTAILDHIPKDIGVDFSGYADCNLHPNFIDFFTLAVSRGFTVSVYTTFEGMSWEHYGRFKQIPFEILSIHLPDVNELIHLRWTEDYKRILHALNDDPPKCVRQDRMCVKGPLHPDVAFLEPVRIMHIQPRSGNVPESLSRHESFHADPLKCGRGNNLRQNVALPDGSVYLCCCDYGMVHNLGNLTRQTFDELDAERAKLIDRQKKPDEKLLCSTCEFAVPL